MDSVPARVSGLPSVTASLVEASCLGSREFRSDYGIRYAYVAGSMYKAISSKELVVAMGKAGLIGFYGAGGIRLEEVESAIRYIQGNLAEGQVFGMNLINAEQPQLEERTVDLFLKCGIRYVEASAYMRITAPLVRYRLKGATRDAAGNIVTRHRVLAKVSHPEIAAAFMQPPPDALVNQLLEAGQINAKEAELASAIPVAQDICVESDSGGHTDRGVALVLLPAMLSLRDEIMATYRYATPIRVGAAGGIGTPKAAVAVFCMGADFILTGSINQCTVEAGTSDAVKDMLQTMNVQDTTYAPAGDMFEMGAKIQVLKKGLLFAARANKLYELYQRHNSLDEIDEKTRQQIQEKYFQRSFEDAWTETINYYAKVDPAKAAAVEKNPKKKMAFVFRWYFIHSTRLAMQGSESQRVDYQIHCGPALGTFNQWVKGTELESWRNRYVVHIAERLMSGTAQMLNEQFMKHVTHR